jgi:hypothetical protein
VEALVATKRPADYDRAVALLNDLRALAEQAGRLPNFHRCIGDLRDRHRRKVGLLERMSSAGLK